MEWKPLSNLLWTKGWQKWHSEDQCAAGVIRVDIFLFIITVYDIEECLTINLELTTATKNKQVLGLQLFAVTPHCLCSSERTIFD